MLNLRARQSATQRQNEGCDRSQQAYCSKNKSGYSAPSLMSQYKTVEIVMRHSTNANHNTKNQTYNDSQNYPASEISSGGPRKYYDHSFHIKAQSA
jgi:hypothetical protein